ncbi:uroporphyrinogen decarboxylase family protein [Anaerosalibacter sp. Marseille-P3206]|uniref:uroporphyrinogen decarboxylase family protein n=1 Tax=Anaerosalibacter sp. Marseille-P3206 TaxID=1871005 RepID=UPI00098411D4|nr:uroporphyrinogen decarboxylase family protein [Anaerosalibacter sp. Marseille-P3206]
MSKVIDFVCVSDQLEEIPESIVKNSGLKFPEVHTKAEYIVTLSKKLMKHKNDILCRLPFCNTVEAEALGGNIKLGDAKTGPRVESYAYSSLDELLDIEEIDLNNRRIAEVLKAVEILREQGETVVLNVEGPFTIITSLIDSRVFYKGIRKDSERVNQFLKIIEDNILKYIKEGINRGAQIISFGDPAGALDIVGPKVYREYSGKSTFNILKRVESVLGNSILHICGKTSTTFQNMGLIESHPIKLKEDITYGQAIEYILSNRMDVKVIGHNCIKRTPFKLKNSTIWDIKLNKS